jgi:ketosteroid isomerase-like protein
MAPDNVETTRKVCEAVNDRDLSSFLAAMSADVEAMPRILALEGGTLNGHDGLRRWWDGVLTAFPDFQIEVIDIQALGDGATVAELTLRARGQGGGVPLEDHVWNACRFEDGAISWWRTCESETQAFEALRSPA